MTGVSRRGLLGAVAVTGSVSPRQATAAHPDSAIISLCAAHIANFNAYNISTHDEGSSEDLLIWDEYMRTRRTIDEVRPLTMAGVMAKAKVAKVEASNPSGKEDWEYSVVADWSRDIVNDLLRLNGAVV